MTPYCTLTADGRVLTSAEYVAGDDRIPFDDRGGLFYLPPSHPLVWEAPDCWSCEGSGRIGVDDHERDCHVCDGTGVDDSIPLTLVGVGSVLAAVADGRTAIVVEDDNADMGDMCAVWADDIEDWSAFKTATIGTVWRVVRAVPPARTGDTPCR